MTSVPLGFHCRCVNQWCRESVTVVWLWPGGAAAIRVHLPRRARPDRARRHQPRQRARRVLRGPAADGPHA